MGGSPPPKESYEQTWFYKMLPLFPPLVGFAPSWESFKGPAHSPFPPYGMKRAEGCFPTIVFPRDWGGLVRAFFS